MYVVNTLNLVMCNDNPKVNYKFMIKEKKIFILLLVGSC